MPQPYVDFGHVKEHASFERVLEHYNLKLTGRGTQRAVLCPFHQERRPSCKIELARKIFHCFGCGQKGNVLEFVAKLDATDLRAAAMKITTVCAIAPAPPRSDDRPARQPAAKTPIAAPRSIPNATPPSAAAEEPVNPPLTFELKLDAAHPYLSERRLSPETVAQFGLGYCNRGLMKGRICIPIHDAAGNLVAYAGRWADTGAPPDGEDKYKLPAKFQKNRVLFNLNRLDDVTHLVAVEGFWSAIRLHTTGIPAVALMGSSISEDQIALLHERGTRSLVLLLDGDTAGYQARERLLPELTHWLFVRSPKLAAGEKPDTLEEPALRELAALPFP
jgi:DNA primase